MTKQEMRTRVPFLRELTYSERLEADRVIEQGADVALLYFWFNLKKGNYKPYEHAIDVKKEVDYFCQRNPLFEPQIRKWYAEYQGKKEAVGAV